MVSGHRGKPEAFLENYCSRLGTLLEARYTGLALLAAKQEADAAAKHANEAMLEAKAADLAKTQFLANMAHELRTPLNAIIGFSEIIKLDVIQTKERYPQYAEYIHDAGILLLNIINGLLDLARIQAGRVDLEEQIVAVGEVIQSAICTIAPIAERKLIDVDCELVHSSTLICVDQTKFKQIARQERTRRADAALKRKTTRRGRLQMLAAQAVVDTSAQTLRLEKMRCTGAMRPSYQRRGVVFDTGSAGIGGPSVGLGDGAWCEVAGDKAMQAVASCRHLVQANAAWAGPRPAPRGADDQHLTLVAAAPPPARDRSSATGNFGLVDLTPPLHPQPAV